MKQKILALFIASFLCFLLPYIFLQYSANSDTLTSVKLWIGIARENKSKSTFDLERLTEVNRLIARAHRYSRSSVAMYELSKAFSIVNDMLKTETNSLLIEKLTSDPGVDPEVCPEIYKGMKYGYPYYLTGYITDTANCQSQKLSTTLTVALNAVNDIALEDMARILKGLSVFYPDLSVFIACDQNQKDLASDLKRKFANTTLGINLHFYGSNVTSGYVWKNLSGFIKTKYVFIGRGLLRFDNQTSFERMLRFLSYSHVDVVAGSHRFLDGRWYRGCFAIGLRNYTLKLVDGYDLSYNSCIYCDYVSSPLMLKTQLFHDSIDDTLNDDMVFMDFLLNLRWNVDNSTILTCPDVMFVIKDKQTIYTNHSKIYWLDFVIKWQLNRIILPNRDALTYNCVESKTKCLPHKGGLIMPICCLQELVDAIKFMAIQCEKHGIDCEVEAGSGVGAVKMYGVTPYERDADFDWLSFNRSVMQSMVEVFEKNNYQLEETPTNYSQCLYSNINCGYYAFRTPNWRLELWGATYLGSDQALSMGLKHRTKINFDGVWVTTLHSPALAARNEYGDDIFEHVEHWSTLGHSTGWVQPTTGRFMTCPRPGFHGCLDLYLPVGNIQFQDVWI